MAQREWIKIVASLDELDVSIYEDRVDVPEMHLFYNRWSKKYELVLPSRM